MAEHHVFCDGEPINQAKMLVHHRDAMGKAITRAVETNLFAVAQHLANLRPIQTAQY